MKVLFFSPVPSSLLIFPGARKGKNSKKVAAAADGGTVGTVHPVPQQWQTACQRERLDVWGPGGDSQPDDEREGSPVLVTMGRGKHRAQPKPCLGSKPPRAELCRGATADGPSSRVQGAMMGLPRPRFFWMFVRMQQAGWGWKREMRLSACRGVA